MTDERISPKLSETGFYRIVNEMIETAYLHYHTFIGLPSGSNPNYNPARSSLLALYNAVIIPHAMSHKGDKEVKEFQESWERLNERYGDQFEKAKGNYDEINIEEAKQEYIERFTAIMTFLNVLGITQLKQRAEEWEDNFIEVSERELR